MKRLFPIIIFYRSLIMWSFIINILLSVIGLNFIIIALIKVLLLFFLWQLIDDFIDRKTLRVFRNRGFSILKLFLFVYLVDITLSIPFLLVLGEFI